jgi:predicted transposase YbfD/YdcC
MAAPLLDAIDIQGKEITADALLTQRKFARYLVEERQADYHFTVKGNQPPACDEGRHGNFLMMSLFISVIAMSRTSLITLLWSMDVLIQGKFGLPLN